MSEIKKIFLEWKDIIQLSQKLKERAEELLQRDNLKYYGVPRGGAYISALLNQANSPEEADIIVDDIIDSGDTQRRYQKEYDKPFLAIINPEDKPDKNTWIVFPWEVKDEPVEDNFKRILQYLGEDTEREGLKDTPKRYIKFLKEFLQPKEFNFTAFDSEGLDEMIVQTNIPFYSLCEHHTAPFFGTATIAYIPDGKIVGLSKLSRVVDLYANRFQNQERITSQIAERLQMELNPKGVAVSLKAQHLCMAMRGVKKHDTWTITSKLVGAFKDDDKARNEFLRLIHY
ncbi:FolE GTP cyclohydrolase I [uncultured Caudovirales phage]|uniref:GTP cyclohydrolase I n=1 Tax=uncultured Caudovirales phage TaxID=2100421 RepID=A0A6J7X226_9CAUD|nr:FolE GTP cyclohydrolase I [uncultured Caudovirales phage]